MNKKTVLSILGLVLASGAWNSTSSDSKRDLSSIEVDQAIRQLEEAGLVRIEKKSGQIVLEKSILEVLKKTGIAKEVIHSNIKVAGCNSTNGMSCSSPS